MTNLLEPTKNELYAKKVQKIIWGYALYQIWQTIPVSLSKIYERR